MVQIARILCPIDFSDCSRRALEHAVALARWYEAKVVVFHVFSPLPLPMTESALAGYEPGPLPPPPRPEDVIEEVQRFLGPPLGDMKTPDIMVRPGSPVAEIVAQAVKTSADLLVIGTHGRSGFEKLILGSVADKVLRKVRCPVLTVPPPVEHAATGPVLFKTILCPIDFSPSSTRALEYALSLAKESDARLVLLHSLQALVDETHLGEMAHFTVPEYHRHVKADAAKKLKSAVPDEARNWCKPEEILTSGSAHRAILRVAGETGAELIVMGVQGRGAADLMFFGSTTNHVIRAATCPVLTLRE